MKQTARDNAAAEAMEAGSMATQTPPVTTQPKEGAVGMQAATSDASTGPSEDSPTPEEKVEQSLTTLAMFHTSSKLDAVPETEEEAGVESTSEWEAKQGKDKVTN